MLRRCADGIGVAILTLDESIIVTMWRDISALVIFWFLLGVEYRWRDSWESRGGWGHQLSPVAGVDGISLSGLRR